MRKFPIGLCLTIGLFKDNLNFFVEIYIYVLEVTSENDRDSAEGLKKTPIFTYNLAPIEKFC